MCQAWPCCDRRYNVRCYDADGNTRWLRRFEAPHPHGGPKTIALDNERVYVGGTARDADNIQRFSVRCYDRQTGATLWTSNAALWPWPANETTVPTEVVDLVIDAAGQLHGLPLELDQPLNPHVHQFDLTTGDVLQRYTALTITPDALVAERFLSIGGDGRSYISSPGPNRADTNTRGLAALSDGKLVLAGTNFYLAGPDPNSFPLNVLDDFQGSFFAEGVRRHSYVDPDGPGAPHVDVEAMGGVCVDGSDRITFTGGPIWNGTALRSLGQYDRDLNQLWTRPGQFDGPIGCNATGRLAAVMRGHFRQAEPPVGQGHRFPSLAVLNATGDLEWSHYHGDTLTSDVAVAPDGWVATCGPLRPAYVREWDFLNDLVGT